MNKLIPIILGLLIVCLVLQKVGVRGSRDEYDYEEPRERSRGRRSRGRRSGRGRRSRSGGSMGQMIALLAAAQTARKLVGHFDDFSGHDGRSHSDYRGRSHDRRSSRGEKLRGWIGA
jgi:hypothetical protein